MPVASDDVDGEPRADDLTLGTRIRGFRELRRVSLRGLAADVGASPGFLSQLERGKARASVSMLRRIAEALGLTMAELFDDGVDVGSRVLRRNERPEIETTPLSRKFLLSRRPLRSMEVYVGEFAVGGDTGAEAYTHGDALELLVVLSGEVRVELDGQSHMLAAGDSIEYRTSVAHRTVNTGDGDAEVLWVISPPTP
jgi:transcriptional regulator with XRE-family HTH domain